jgi:nicotinate-nucleotide pyrophosphorylase (carboxylating)
MSFTAAETDACRRLLVWAMMEDWNDQRQVKGDITSDALIPREQLGRAIFVARSAGIVAGLPAVAVVMDDSSVSAASSLSFHALRKDGTKIAPGDHLATIAGRMRSILGLERIALNCLQHLSGIASLTRLYVDAIAGLPCAILDTRKTLPGWRLLEKYAVRQGGGHNHRIGLYDGILIKDNHVAALGGDLAKAIEKSRDYAGRSVPLEVEVDTLDQLDVALSCHPDIILLDNMGVDQLREAVRRRNVTVPEVRLEASGGVTLDTVRAIAETGVDRISVGALTHSAPALDIALDYVQE